MTEDRRGIIPFIVSIAIPICVGMLSALLTREEMAAFETFNKPPLAPPSWLFSVAWTILYILMGIACYFIYISDSELRMLSLLIFGMQLFFNFFWSLIFFNLEMYWLAFVWLLAMWVMIIALLVLTSKFSLIAMFCLLPLAIWSTFAAYLNAGIAVLN